MWTIAKTDEYERRFKWYSKKLRRELAAVLDNLDTYFAALRAGTKPLQIKAGFIHPEGCGVVAVDQKGGGKNLAQTRLYFFPDLNTEVVHLITLGDKNSQSEDIKTCHTFVAQLAKGGASEHEQQETI